MKRGDLVQLADSAWESGVFVYDMPGASWTLSHRLLANDRTAILVVDILKDGWNSVKWARVLTQFGLGWCRAHWLRPL